MNKLIRTIKMLLSFYLLFGSSLIVNAKSPTPTPQVPLPDQAYTVDELQEAINTIEAAYANQDTPKHIYDNCEVQRVVFARGIQSYKSDGENWSATGPLADLYATDFLEPEEDVIHIDFEGGKIGSHYQSLTSPSWEFSDGRATVDISEEHKDVFKLAYSQGDVAWLNVALRDDDAPGLASLGYDRLYRVLTNGGVAPVFKGSADRTIGTGYTTFYVFVTCTEVGQ